MTLQKIWQFKKSDIPLQRLLSLDLGVDPVIAQLLINRGIRTSLEAKQFLYPSVHSLLDPFLFKNMDKVVERIKSAQQKSETVLVFGDYDVDGVTSSVLLTNLLNQLGISVINYIPHRVHDGYGLNHEIAQFAKEKGVTLLMAVDCGISAIEEVDTINKEGIEVIIIDHHEPSEILPKASAIINPKQKDCPYPFKDMASVGLVMKLIQAVLGEVPHDLFEFVAIGTIADVVPLRGENRIFVKTGLPKIGETKNKGLMALLEVAKIKGKPISPHSVGFILGPRINATGRMDSAHKSLELFLSNDWQEAYQLAQLLEEHNASRQKMQRDIVAEAMNIVEREVNFNDHKVIVLSKEGWHKGVLGIVASKIVEKYYRPSIVISLKDGVGTASARSIDGFHLYEALTECSHCLVNYGGHSGAAGLTIRTENIDSFRTVINEFAHRTMEVKKLIPTVLIDCEIALSSVSMGLVELIQQMEPFGEGNPEPVFCTRHLMVKSAPVILGKETIKFWVTDGKATISAVGFGMAKYRDLIKLGQPVDLAYQLIIDDWNKTPTTQLKLKDVQLSEVS